MQRNILFKLKFLTRLFKPGIMQNIVKEDQTFNDRTTMATPGLLNIISIQCMSYSNFHNEESPIIQAIG